MSTYTENNKTCINLVVTTLCLDNPVQDIGVSGMLDFFPWLILNIFGIGLMWTILMAAMKSTAFTGGIVDSIEKVAKNVVTTAEIIPIGGGTSLSAIKKTGNRIRDSIEAASETNANTVVAPGIENYFQRNFTGQVGKGKAQITGATAKIASRNDVNREVGAIVGAGGALYNAPNSIISLEGNQLDLSQYGQEGLDMVNKTAEVGKL